MIHHKRYDCYRVQSPPHWIMSSQGLKLTIYCPLVQYLLFFPWTTKLKYSKYNYPFELKNERYVSNMNLIGCCHLAPCVYKPLLPVSNRFMDFIVKLFSIKAFERRISHKCLQ